MSQKLIGDEIIRDLMKRVAHLEKLIICQTCEGSGEVIHRILGEVNCTQCEGTGNRLDGHMKEQFYG